MRKAIPVRVDSYQRLRGEDYYTVDESRVITEFLERKVIVALIMRPRHFHRNIADTFGIRQEAHW